MLLNNIVIVVAVGMQSLAVHPIMFIVGRFISGINSGTYNYRHIHVILMSITLYEFKVLLFIFTLSSYIKSLISL